MDSKAKTMLIINLISGNNTDSNLVKFGAAVLKNIDGSVEHFAFSQHLKSKDLVAEEYFKEFETLCFREVEDALLGKGKEYCDKEGKAHRDVKEGDVLLPARIFGENKFFLIHGKPVSPGVDANKLSLPHVVHANGDKEWLNEDGKRHREEKAADGSMLGAFIKADGTQEWWLNGEKFSKEDMDKKFPVAPTERTLELKGKKFKKMTLNADRMHAEFEYDDSAKEAEIVIMQAKEIVDFKDNELTVVFNDGNKTIFTFDIKRLAKVSILPESITMIMKFD
jgi:hypothetical protein